MFQLVVYHFTSGTLTLDICRFVGFFFSSYFSLDLGMSGTHRLKKHETIMLNKPFNA